jgi:hypothetical protein
MKKVDKITGWTDYPIVEFGDIAGQRAPIRRVRVTGYDGNKYATVEVYDGKGGVALTSFKAGYIYGKPGRSGQVKPINRDKIRVAFGYDTIARYYTKQGAIIYNRDRWGGFSVRWPDDHFN